jgi:hypothetical protein
MNQRIRDLAHEAGLPTYNPEGIPTKLEKFAQLIIQECMDVVSEDVSDDDDAAESKEGAHPYWKIVKHFGVEV